MPHSTGDTAVWYVSVDVVLLVPRRRVQDAPTYLVRSHQGMNQADSSHRVRNQGQVGGQQQLS
jgi:hypothetical protein